METSPTATPWYKDPTQLLSLAIMLFIFASLSRTISFWNYDPNSYLLAGKWLTLLSLLLALGLGVSLKRAVLSFRPDVYMSAVALLVLFLSDWLCRDYSLLKGPSVRGEIILGGLAFIGILRSQSKAFINVIALGAILLLIACFFAESSGRLLFSDDHPTFLYRLMLLKEHFPFIPFYNPLWNGGIDARDFFATGSLNVFFLTAPLIYLFNLIDIYDLIIVSVLFVIVPGATYLAAKIEELPPPVPLLASALALSSNLLWYRWALKYGTMGFACSAGLVPLNVMLAAKILDPERELRLREALLFVASATLMLFWSPSGFVFLPAALVGLFRLKILLRKRFVPQILVVLLAINLPWIALFWSVSNVSHFVQLQKGIKYAAPARAELVGPQAVPAVMPTPAPTAPAGLFRPKKSLKILREAAISMNPLILFFTLPGLALLRKRTLQVVLPVLGWLLFIGTLIAPLKAQIELDRMLIILGIVCAIPTAAALHQLWSAPSRRLLAGILGCLCGGFFIAGVLSTGAMLLNRTLEQYSFSSDLLPQFAAALREHGGEGRILFSGFVLHELDQGHIAPLVLLSGKPLLASSYAHDKWFYQQIFPADFIKRGDEGIREYLDLYNATAVVAHERPWREYFTSHPAEYELLWHGGVFNIFRRKDYTSNYFLEGSGSIISQSSNGVTLNLDTPDAVVKFNYFPFLKAEGCTVSAYEASGGIRLVKLGSCPVHTPIRLEAKPGITRIWQRS